jgi:hypothetical protein
MKRQRARRRRWVICGIVLLLLVGVREGVQLGVLGGVEENTDRTRAPAPPDARHAPAVDAPSPAVEPRDPAVADHLSGCLRRAALARDPAAFADACTALDEAAELELDSAQRAELARAHGDLERALDVFVAGVVADVRAGRVLTAARTLTPLARSPHSACNAARDRIAAGLAVRIPARPLADPPVPPPLPPGRAVRLWHEDRLREGHVVEGAQRVSVRVVTPQGTFFPAVERAALEPVDADADEALAQCAAAFVSGDEVAASLWWAYARTVDSAVGGPDPLRRAVEAR